MRYFLLVVTLFLFPSFACASARPVDFAYGRPLLLKENGAVYGFDIPLEVYRTVTTNDLRDIRIFNNADAAVPHILRLPKTKEEASDITKALPIFPLYRKKNTTGAHDLSVRVNKHEDGTIIDIESDDSGADKRQKLSGYLIDISNHRMPIDALDLVWTADTEDFITDVALEHSDDLTKWTPLVFRSTIVLKRFSGQKIVMNRIRMPGRTPQIAAGRTVFGSHSTEEMSTSKPEVGYLRLRWLSNSDGIELKKILAVQQTGAPQRERIWTVIDGISGMSNPDDKITAYEYDSAAWLPVDRIRICFPEKNTVAQIKIFSKPDQESEWRYRQSGVFYSLQFDKTSLIEDTAPTGLTSDRYWRLEIDGSNAGGFVKSPVVKLGWLPHELLFVAQGEGPYVMAYGSARLDRGELENDSSELISRVVEGNSDMLIKKAVLSAKTVLGGPELLVPLPPPLPWRDWLLWCVLIVGVGIIGKMAVSLLKSMDK